MPYPTVHLKPGRERPILAGHPWVFSGALRNVPSTLEPGEIVDVLDAGGKFVARGYLQASHSLALRVLSLDSEEAIDQDFFTRRIQRAAELRAPLATADTSAYRLVHAEGDELPGLIVDRYDRWLVAQVHTAGMERQRAAVIAALRQAVAPEGILLRRDMGVRAREGLPVGAPEVAWGEVPETITMRESGIRYLVDPYHGQKTGFFLDQRDQRAHIRACAPHARTLLNCFAYSGSFALAGLAANPDLRTISVDTSKAALDLARQNFALNGHALDPHEFIAADVVTFLKSATREGTQYDVVVVDPPAYAKTLESKHRALHGYDTLNTLAARTVAPGGYLLTCSCSGVIDLAEFEAVVHAALLHAQRRAQIVAASTVSRDHPTLPGFPEDRYLKALLLRLA